MLVLTRKEAESICIGDNIVTTVSRIQGKRVRFAIEAPKEIRIVRNELLHAVAPTPRTLMPPAFDCENALA